MTDRKKQPRLVNEKPERYWDTLLDHEKFDGNLDAFMRRMDRLCELLVERGSFSRDEASNVLVSISTDRINKAFELTERAAEWLRIELKNLRDGEKVEGKAPVLTGQSLSRLLIADLAMTMVAGLEEQPGPELIALLMELLNVDRHRRSLGAAHSEEKDSAMQLEAQVPNVGVRELAKHVGVAPSTITAWRRDPDYEKHVKLIRRLQNGWNPFSKFREKQKRK